MTIIAWDGKTLASDRRVTFGSSIRERTKIYKIKDDLGNDYLIGSAGRTDAGEELIKWFKDGRKHDDFPDHLRKSGDDCLCELLVINEKGEVLLYQNGPVPITFDNKFFAIGSGASVAISAMHCNKTAKEAVEITSLYDCLCGNGVDVLTFNEEDNPQ